jgi:hypothetical protein
MDGSRRTGVLQKEFTADHFVVDTSSVAPVAIDLPVIDISWNAVAAHPE